MSPCIAAWQHRILAVWQRKGLVSTLLLPLSWLYALALHLRRWRHGRRSQPDFPRPPIIVVGNLVVGGTGKTPVVIALAQALAEQGWHPGIISRGYGARIGAQPRVGLGELAAAQFGDEPVLIARATDCPVAVHPRRVLALQALLQAHPDVDVVIADDGLQHLALPRDIVVIVQDGRGVGNGRLLPAGPLREPAGQLCRAHTLITNLTAQSQPGATAMHAPAAEDSPAVQPAHPTLVHDVHQARSPSRPRQVIMRLVPSHVIHLASGRQLDWAAWLQTQATARLAAVAGIGQPSRFFDMLTQHGLRLAQTRALPDHGVLTDAALRDLRADAILVTEKDAVKLPRCLDPRLWSVQVQPAFSIPDWPLAIADTLRACVARDGTQAAGHDSPRRPCGK